MQSPIAGAIVRVGSLTTTTAADGRFTLESVPVGTVGLQVDAEGFDRVSRPIELRQGTNDLDVLLFRSLAIHEQGAFTLALPPETSEFRGVIHFLPGDGGETRRLVRGEEDIPAARDFRGRFLVLAEVYGLAFLGNDHVPTSDPGAAFDEILATLADLAARGGHPELSDAPVLLMGYSAGGCLAHHFTRARPDRVIGFVTIKGGCHLVIDSGAAKDVPAYLFIGESDLPSRGDNITALFELNRAAGARWAVAIEPGTGHEFVADNELLANWADAVLDRRLPAPGSPGTLPALAETSGWLGDRGSFAIASYGCYPGDAGTASWLPSETTARDWQELVSEGQVTTVITC